MKKIIATGALTASILTAGVVAHADGRSMPDLKGKGLITAYSVLGHGTKIRVTDATGEGRHVLWAFNWKICDQKPEAGAPEAAPVRLAVVKRMETCPVRPGQ